jgi:hypothetical protein
LLSGLSLAACGGVVEEQSASDAAHEVGSDPYDGGAAGLYIDTGSPYDGGAVGTAAPYDGGAVGTADAIAEPPDEGVDEPYDGGAMGTIDAPAGDAVADIASEAIGGPLVAPELPFESLA